MAARSQSASRTSDAFSFFSGRDLYDETLREMEGVDQPTLSTAVPREPKPRRQKPRNKALRTARRKRDTAPVRISNLYDSSINEIVRPTKSGSLRRAPGPKKTNQRRAAQTRMSYTAYTAYLRSPEWQKFRKRYKNQRRWECAMCGGKDFLQLHHQTYERLGHEELDDCVPLCERCHTLFHKALKARQITSLKPDFLSAPSDEPIKIGWGNHPPPKPTPRKRPKNAGSRGLRPQLQRHALDSAARKAKALRLSERQELLNLLAMNLVDKHSADPDKDLKAAKNLIKRTSRKYR